MPCSFIEAMRALTLANDFLSSATVLPSYLPFSAGLSLIGGSIFSAIFVPVDEPDIPVVDVPEVIPDEGCVIPTTDNCLSFAALSSAAFNAGLFLTSITVGCAFCEPVCIPGTKVCVGDRFSFNTSSSLSNQSFKLFFLVAPFFLVASFSLS